MKIDTSVLHDIGLTNAQIKIYLALLELGETTSIGNGLSGIGIKVDNSHDGKKKMDKIKVSTVGNPAMHLPSLMGIIPGMSAFATSQMKKEMDKIDIPPVSEFVEMIHEAGARLYACKATVDMFHLKY